MKSSLLSGVAGHTWLLRQVRVWQKIWGWEEQLSRPSQVKEGVVDFKYWKVEDLVSPAISQMLLFLSGLHLEMQDWIGELILLLRDLDVLRGHP